MLGILDAAVADGAGVAVDVGGVLGSNESSLRVLTGSGVPKTVVSWTATGSENATGVSTSVDSFATDGVGGVTASFSLGGNDGSWLGSLFTLTSSKSDKDSSADDNSDSELKSIKSLSMSGSTAGASVFFFLVAGKLLLSI